MIAKIYFLVTLALSSSLPDFYWRPYNGEIPEDALNATETTRHYVGRGPHNRDGLILGEIVPGDPTLLVGNPDTGKAVTINQYIEILCTPSPDSYSWIPVNYETLAAVAGKIQGAYEHDQSSGHEIDNGVLYIGRSIYSGAYRVGKVAGYHNSEWNPKSNRLYIADINNGQVAIDDYEVLVYNN